VPVWDTISSPQASSARPRGQPTHRSQPRLLRRFPTRTDPCHLVAFAEGNIRARKPKDRLTELSASPPVVCLDSRPPCVSDDTSRYRHARGETHETRHAAAVLELWRDCSVRKDLAVAVRGKGRFLQARTELGWAGTGDDRRPGRGAAGPRSVWLRGAGSGQHPTVMSG
jgi:hypothetical protein